MGGGGLITGCIALFTEKSSLFKTNGPVTQCSGPVGNGPVSQWGRFSVGGGGLKRKFTVFTTRDTYNSTH